MMAMRVAVIEAQIFIEKMFLQSGLTRSEMIYVLADLLKRRAYRSVRPPKDES